MNNTQRMNNIQRINRLLLLTLTPFLGMLIFLFTLHPDLKAADFIQPAPIEWSLSKKSTPIKEKLNMAYEDSGIMKASIEKSILLYNQTNTDVVALLNIATSQVSRPNQVFENRVSTVLGKPIRQSTSSNIDLKLYTYSSVNYKGYALKVNLKSKKAMQMVLGKDKLGGSETTLSAVSRYGAIAGINAGGFADAHSERFPTGNTIYNGKFIYGFFPLNTQIVNTFVGLNQSLKLVGGTFSRQSELESLEPTFGASFEPVLIKENSKQAIPTKWLTSPVRSSRTVMGSFRNNQLLILIAEGANETGHSGATLPELQDSLQNLGIRDAYNLDGGGSTTLIFGDTVINKPSDGHMRLLPTHFLFFK